MNPPPGWYLPKDASTFLMDPHSYWSSENMTQESEGFDLKKRSEIGRLLVKDSWFCYAAVRPPWSSVQVEEALHLMFRERHKLSGDSAGWAGDQHLPRTVVPQRIENHWADPSGTQFIRDSFEEMCDVPVIDLPNSP